MRAYLFQNALEIMWLPILIMVIGPSRVQSGPTRDKQITLPLRGRTILCITRMITDKIGRHEVLLIIINKNHVKIRESN